MKERTKETKNERTNKRTSEGKEQTVDKRMSRAKRKGRGKKKQLKVAGVEEKTSAINPPRLTNRYKSSIDSD